MQRIKDLRTRGIGTYGIQADASVHDAVREFLDKDISALVVYDGSELVGISRRTTWSSAARPIPTGFAGSRWRTT